MIDHDLNETFPGLDPVNGFYTPFYMQEYFSKGVNTAAARWKELPAEQRPAYRVRAQRQTYAAVVNGDDGLLEEDAIGSFVDGLLDALGYGPDDGVETDVVTIDPQNGVEIAVRAQVSDSHGRPQVQVLASLVNDPDSGILESRVERSDRSCEECARMLLADFDQPARWIVAVGLRQAVLIDRRKWGDKQCMLFDFDTIFSRNEPHVYEAVAVLLHRTSLCPADGDSVLDSFDDESSKQAVSVSESLRSALRECVEILGNEVIHDWTVNKGRPLDGPDGIDASDLTVQCLRYMYRLLFLLFIEAKPDLGYAPMKSESYPHRVFARKPA